MPKNSGKTDGFGTRLTRKPGKYDTMRMNDLSRKSKTIYRKLSIEPDIINDCVSSWLTATGFINRNTFVDHIQPDSSGGYLVTVKECNGDQEET